MSWIESESPDAVGRYTITSECTAEYNCIAWAAGDDSRWWQHHPGYHWPAQRSPLVSSLVGVFESLGFAVCDNGEIESGFDKVAIYADRGMWSHAARQLESGKWTSKLGPDEDIEHDNAECLGGLYGAVYCYMKRPMNDGD